jgi:hypothetical protein
VAPLNQKLTALWACGNGIVVDIKLCKPYANMRATGCGGIETSCGQQVYDSRKCWCS